MSFLLLLFFHFGNAAKPDSVQKVAFSGSGLPGALGSLIATEFLDSIFPTCTEVHGAGSGAWGLILSEIGNLAKVGPTLAEAEIQKREDAMVPIHLRSYYDPKYENLRSSVASLLAPAFTSNLKSLRVFDDKFHPNKQAFIHLLVSDAEGEDHNCWFTNVDSSEKGKKPNFGCVNNPQPHKTAIHTILNHPPTYQTRLPQPKVVNVATYSNPGDTESEELLTLLAGLNTYVEVQDDPHVNTPLIKIFVDWELNPTDQLVYAFDFTTPNGKTYELLDVITDINDQMKNIFSVDNYLDISTKTTTSTKGTVVNDCFMTFTRTSSSKTLTLRFFGLCGIVDNAAVSTWISIFDPLDMKSALKGNAKWKAEDVKKFVDGYSGFLKKAFKENYVFEAKKSPKDPLKEEMKLDKLEALDALKFSCEFKGANFLEEEIMTDSEL